MHRLYIVWFRNGIVMANADDVLPQCLMDKWNGRRVSDLLR